jgi:hypothetical protein
LRDIYEQALASAKAILSVPSGELSENGLEHILALIDEVSKGRRDINLRFLIQSSCFRCIEPWPEGKTKRTHPVRRIHPHRHPLSDPREFVMLSWFWRPHSSRRQLGGRIRRVYAATIDALDFQPAVLIGHEAHALPTLRTGKIRKASCHLRQHPGVGLPTTTTKSTVCPVRAAIHNALRRTTSTNLLGFSVWNHKRGKHHDPYRPLQKFRCNSIIRIEADGSK